MKQPRAAISPAIPVIDFKVTVFDGSYHGNVDSNELTSFKTAGRLCLQERGWNWRKPFVCSKLRDRKLKSKLLTNSQARSWAISTAAAAVGGMESKGLCTTVINAQVPMAEMLAYGTQLTSMTQGKGSYHMEVDHYDIVPQLVADKILANAKRPVDEEVE